MSNPAVTFRIAPEDRERLDKLREMTDKTLGQLLRENLGVAERDVQSAHDLGWDEGRAIGIEQGRKQGKKEWAISYCCNVCGTVMEIAPNGPEHQIIVNALHEKQWGHKKCHESSK